MQPIPDSDDAEQLQPHEDEHIRLPDWGGTVPSVFVLGAGPGIGAAVSRRFAVDGFAVGLLARSSSTVERIAAELPGTTATATANVADEDGLRTALDELVHALGVPAVLVYNAGIVRTDGPGSLDAATLQATHAVNVGGALTAAAALLPRMAAAGGGRYLLTAGMPAPLPQLTSLSLGKAGLRALAELLDRHYAGDGVRTATVTVCGPVAPGTRYDPDDIADRYAELRDRPDPGWVHDVRFGDPADAAG
ncbi:SDR family oxidoreductase [Pseudonocardia nantongensis]|uniref:SDR family oxidoreductase n=1 Tax=Pseudonocardia nantongensis TaxID=1181885 RepID=UPI00397E4847